MDIHRCRVLITACVLVGGLFAVTNGQPPPVDPAKKTKPKPPAAKTADAATWERLIYLPYKNIKGAIDKHGGTVFLPYLEYLKLWERSNGGQRPLLGKPKVSAVITESHYKGTIAGKHANISATLKVDVLDTGWVSVPVNFGNAAVGKVAGGEGDKKVLLKGTGKGTYALLFPDKGEYEVTLELTTRVRTSPDGQSLAFDCPPVGITTFELAVPEADQTVKVEPHLVTLPAAANPAAAAKETRVKASLGSTTAISARWSPKAGLKPEMALLATVTNSQTVSIADGLVHAEATLDYKVLRGEIQQLVIVVPPNVSILDVAANSAKLKAWKVAAEKSRKVITVDLLAPVKDKLTLELHTERPLPDEAFDVIGIDKDGVVHGIHTEGVLRESGRLTLTYSSDLLLAIQEQQGVVRVDQADIPQAQQKARGLYYKFYGTDVRLNLAANPVQPRLTVTQQARLVFGDDQIDLTTGLAYRIERAGVFELLAELPDDVVVDDVQCNAMKEFSVDKAAQTLRIVLNQKRTGDVAVTVLAHLEFEAEGEAAELAIPVIKPLGVVRETGTISLFAPNAIEVEIDETTLAGLRPVPGVAGARINDARLASTWSYTRRPIALTVRTSRRPTRLSARVGTTVTVREDLAEVATLLSYDVEHAGVDTFRFAVPEAISASVNIESVTDSAAIRERTPAEEAEEGWVTWTVVMQQEVLGRQTFRVTYDIQPASEVADDADANDADKEAAAITFSVTPIRPLGLAGDDEEVAAIELSQVVGELAVEKERSLSVTATTANEDVETIDVRELELLQTSGYLAFSYTGESSAFTLRATRHDIQNVVETIVSKALVEIVIGRGSTAGYRCRYQIRTSERQRLSIDVPLNMELLGAFIGSEPVDLEKNDETTAPEGRALYSVNLTGRSSAEESFLLTLQFSVPAAALGRGGGRRSLIMPRIGGDQYSAAVQELRTVVWVPDDYSLVGTPADFVLETQPRLIAGMVGPMWYRHRTEDFQSGLNSWIDDAQPAGFEFPTEGHGYVYRSWGGAPAIEIDWWEISLFTWVLSGAILFIGFVLRKTPWENKLGVLLLIAFGAGLYGLKDSSAVIHGWAAAQYGVMAMLGLWLIHTLFGSASHHESHSTTGSPAAYGAPLAVVVPPPGIFEPEVEVTLDTDSTTDAADVNAPDSNADNSSSNNDLT
jgi:hypothetical protein